MGDLENHKRVNIFEEVDHVKYVGKKRRDWTASTKARGEIIQSGDRLMQFEL